MLGAVDKAANRSEPVPLPGAVFSQMEVVGPPASESPGALVKTCRFLLLLPL